MKFLPVLLLFILIFTGYSPAQQKRPRRQNSINNQLRIAQNLERRGNFQRALDIFKKLYQEVPANQFYYEGIKRTMLQLKHFDELLQIINKQIARTNDARFYADVGNVYYRMNEADKAFEVWQGTVSQFANSRATYTYIANAMLANRLYDEAIEVYEQGRKHLKEPSSFVFELANIYVLRLKFKAATREYLSHLETNPNQFNYIESRIVGYTKDRDRAFEIADVLKNSLRKSGQKYLIRKLMADIYLRVKEFGLALEQFKIMEKLSPQNKKRDDAFLGKELYFFADKALRAEKYAYAEDAFQLILNNYPKSNFIPKAMFGLAVSKQKQGLSAEALLQFREVIKKNGITKMAQESQFQIGEIYYEKLFDLEKAVSAYKALLSRYPKNKFINQAYFRLGDCNLAAGKYSDAAKWYFRSKNLLQPRNGLYDQATYKIAYLLFLQADYDSALVTLDEILDKMGNATVNQDYANDALELSFLIQENKDKNEQALRIYSSARKLHLRKNYKETADTLQTILDKFPSAPVVELVLLDLGNIENLQGNHAQAISNFEKLLGEHPESVYNGMAQKRIAEIYETNLVDLQKAFQAYEKVLVNYPMSVYTEDVRQKLRELHGRQLNN